MLATCYIDFHVYHLFSFIFLSFFILVISLLNCWLWQLCRTITSSLGDASPIKNNYYYNFLFFYTRYANEPEAMLGQRIGLFSYGSGLASTLFSLTVKPGKAPKPHSSLASNNSTTGCVKSSLSNGVGGTGLFALVHSLQDLEQRLESRVRASPQQFTDVMKLRETTHNLGNSSRIYFIHLKSRTYFPKPIANFYSTYFRDFLLLIKV